MALQRWDPFGEMRRMEDAMDRMWRGFGRKPAGTNGEERWHIPLDVVEDGDDIIVTASLPGVDPDKIEVNVEDPNLPPSVWLREWSGGRGLVRRAIAGEARESRANDPTGAGFGEPACSRQVAAAFRRCSRWL